LNVVEDQVGSPTFTPHLARALVDLAATPSRPEGILHVAAAGQCSWFEFATEIMARAGTGTRVLPCSSAEFASPTPRPAYSLLRSERGAAAPTLPDWRQGLDEYLAGRAVPR
jgi:dTDP-4-dehydrorhamnose reductase